MKKLIIVYVVLIFALILLVLMKGGSNLLSFLPSFGSNATAEVNGKKVKLIVVKDQKAREKGLSGRKSLDKDQGMLFVFDHPDEYGFWMRDMLFAIDIIWINNDKVVYVVKNATPPGQTPALTVYQPDEPANYVLEVTAGEADKLKIKKGTTVKFSGVK